MNVAMRQEGADTQMAILRNVIGIGDDGLVTHKAYDDAVAHASEMKERAGAYAENKLERDLTMRH